MTFEDYLRNKYSKSDRTYKERLSFHHTNMRFLKQGGIDVLRFYLDPKQVVNVMNVLEREFQNCNMKHQSTRMLVFKMYYQYLIQSNIVKNTNQVKTVKQRSSIRYNAQPIIDPPQYGYDDDSNIIFYDESIEENKRVPGLHEFLISEYERIVSVAEEFFNLDSGEYKRIVPVILSDETPAEYEPLSNDVYADLIFKLNSKTGGQFTKHDILNILEKGTVDRIMGEYFTNQNKCELLEGPFIKLYIYNIEYKTEVEYFLKLAMTLAHEYLHHLHHMEIGTIEFERNNAYAKRVKESLADFFSVWYMITPVSGDALVTDRKSVAKKRNSSWIKRYSSGWPYSYALRYFEDVCKFSTDYKKYPNSVIGKYMEVFHTKSLDDAYDILK